MLSICHLIYVFIYVCCLKLIAFQHDLYIKAKLILLPTLLLQIYPNYVLYGMYEIGDCLYVIVFALFYHSSYPLFYVKFVS